MPKFLKVTEFQEKDCTSNMKIRTRRINTKLDTKFLAREKSCTKMFTIDYFGHATRQKLINFLRICVYHIVLVYTIRKVKDFTY